MSTKVVFKAALLHEADKVRVQDMRTKLQMTEKDTMSMIIDFAESHLDEMIEQAAAANKAKEESKEANRKAKYEEFKEAQKTARKLIAAGKIAKSDTTEGAAPESVQEVVTEAATTTSEPSIE